MWVSKFSMPIIGRILKTNIKISQTRSFSKKSCPGDKPSCKPTVKVGGRILRSRSEEHKAALAKCPKKPFKEVCCKPLFAEPPPRCVSSISDDYKRAHLTVKLQATTLTKFVDDSVKTIGIGMHNELESSRGDESSRMRSIQIGVEQKLMQLIELDPACGSAKKNVVRLISEKARHELHVWQCDAAPGLRKINSELSRLSHDTSFKAQTAIALVLCCRNCRSPQALATCVKQNAQEALRILEKANIDAKNRLARIKEYKNEIFHENREAAAEVSKTYGRKMGELSKHLSNCIDEIKTTK